MKPHPYFSGEPLILAHRGASGYAPDHTLVALQLAVQHGADIVEADVHLSRDGHPILHHGGDISENTDGRGPIGRFTLDELRRFDAGYRWSPDDGSTFPFRGRGLSIISLAEALEALPHTRFNLDIKERRAAEPTRRLIDRHEAGKRVLLASWYSWRSAPALDGYQGPRSISLDQMLGFMVLHWSRLEHFWPGKIDALQIPETYRGLRIVTPRLIERAHQLGIRVHVWTVDREADMRRLLGWGVDGIVTKRPDVAARLRARGLKGEEPTGANR